MEAKDTVMDDGELLKFELKYVRSNTFYWGGAFNSALKTQAEISFKAGEAQAYKKWEPAQFKAEKLIRQEAIGEVVEWIKNTEDSCPECGWHFKPNRQCCYDHI